MHACTAHACGVELLLWRGDRLRCGVQRLLFAFLFLSSGAQKLSTFNLSDGGPTMEFMAPKMDIAVQHIERLIGQSLNVPKVHLPAQLALCPAVTGDDSPWKHVVDPA
jgi:HR-like lesion-inducing